MTVPNPWHSFLNAVMFFTRIPIPKNTPYSEELLNRASAWFPLIGWIAGLWSALIFWFAAHIFPTSIAVLLSMLAGILLTGAFHEDGLADASDGFGGGWERDRILDIMKDSRIGTYGVVALVFALLLKWSALSNLSPELIPYAFCIAHPLSRLGAASLIRFGDYARADLKSKAKPLATRMNNLDFAIATICGLLPLIIFPNPLIWLAVPIVFGVAWRAMAYFNKWISGYTGDCLGAVQQLCELITYLTILGISSSAL